MTLPVRADGTVKTIPMQVRNTGTFYVPVNFAGLETNDMMLDTGSEYLVISENTLQQLRSKSLVTFDDNVKGVMANGSTIKIPIYRLASFTIGCCCLVKDVKVAVFGGNKRQILGLNALRKVAPFSISLDPATLTLHNCDSISSRDSATVEIEGKSARRPPGLHEVASMYSSSSGN